MQRLPPNAGKGRVKGVPNKRTVEFLQILAARGFVPAEAIMDIFKIAMEKFVHECEREESGRLSPMESKAAHYLKIASDSAKDLASYSYPKLKAIEQKQPGVLDNMTNEQKLEAMKHAVQALELQMKDGK